ncbi:uncharacterized protein LOC120359825 [Solenopsis invicta]|uniref:uncharacterized protein LOC120359825 n=1 Tax=Solenopsis invicta TaxID=13686 RepID=UPI00193D8177|nr:uncharacterized protein LOC120359825 [Solenopsis invicta]
MRYSTIFHDVISLLSMTERKREREKNASLEREPRSGKIDKKICQLYSDIRSQGHLNEYNIVGFNIGFNIKNEDKVIYLTEDEQTSSASTSDKKTKKIYLHKYRSE